MFVNLTILYRVNTSWTLKEFLDQFVSTKLLDLLQDDSYGKLEECFSQLRAWNCSATLSNTKTILPCGSSILTLVKELFLDIQAVPCLAAPLMEIISKILARFVESCSRKMNSILANTRTEKQLNETKIIQLLQAHSIWQTKKKNRSLHLHGNIRNTQILEREVNLSTYFL